MIECEFRFDFRTYIEVTVYVNQLIFVCNFFVTKTLGFTCNLLNSIQFNFKMDELVSNLENVEQIAHDILSMKSEIISLDSKRNKNREATR